MKKRPTDNSDFDLWWSFYPRCINKAGAKASYDRAILHGATPAAILSGLRAYPFDQDETKQPHPTTWLNQRRWEGYTLRQPQTVIVKQDRASWMNKYDDRFVWHAQTIDIEKTGPRDSGALTNLTGPRAFKENDQ